MGLKWLWFDLDNTLLDFSTASKKAFDSLLTELDVEQGADTYSVYSKINGSLWKRFEAEEITAVEIRVQRFSLLFDEIGLKGTDGLAANNIYMDKLIQYSEAYNGVNELLNRLKEKYKLSIITNGLKEAQRPRLHKTGIYDYFDSIVVSDEIGFSKPNAGIFEHTLHSIQNPPLKDQIMIIGDSPNSDIRGGLQFGIKTCFVSHSKEANNEYPADLVIDNVLELERHL